MRADEHRRALPRQRAAQDLRRGAAACRLGGAGGRGGERVFRPVDRSGRCRRLRGAPRAASHGRSAQPPGSGGCGRCLLPAAFDAGEAAAHLVHPRGG
ncbi:hypothetical protein FJQ54_05500 [Sandaracinobacter neustonicus]|uniref:Uncharacterized protein n=1 Tax=Sandaracinobacter neustonicus TaxID=1715348 RepID=A0A501XQP4_9SPHN|nr:hypothetical protein FJQ54_05500 [Sandaracinobacter neustonicus]